METNKLIRFLIDAREKCSYDVLGESEENLLPDGSKLIGPYEKGPLSYSDRYIVLSEKNGVFDWFEGREMITEEDWVIWERKYGGGITNKDYKEKQITSEMYQNLKLALQKFPRDRPFKRGPDNLVIGDWTYFDKCEGTMESFSGEEKILHNGKEVYAIKYSGGTIPKGKSFYGIRPELTKFVREEE